MPTTCVVCHTQPGPLCADDQDTLTRMLNHLPRRLTQLTAALVPTRTEPAAIPASKSTAATPARIDALSLIGPGSGEPVVRLHPLMRHWSAKRTVTVQTHTAGRARTAQVEVTDWFHEPVIGPDGQPVLVPDDDQVGVVPPREWLDMQVRRWRAHFGHHVPARTIPARPREHAKTGNMWWTLARTRNGSAALALLAAVRAAGAQHERAANVGLLGYQHPWRPDDPLADDIERRFGRPPRHLAVEWDVRYLVTWLPEAAAAGLDIAGFAAELRTLHAEIGRVLGDSPQQQWIGRCPAFITDPDDADGSGRRRPCGAGLWQDAAAFAAQVQCPRCRSVWDTRGPGAAHTAREIRRVWPIDRRRRYSADDIARLPAQTCRGCAGRVQVEWKEVTGTRDRQRWWQPRSTACAAGCEQSRRIL